MLTFEDVEAVVRRVSFRGWRFHVGPMGYGFYIQVRFEAPDTSWVASADDPKVHRGAPLLEQRGRKWYVSSHATTDEVIKTCWCAVDLALRHEAMEEFRLDRIAIFNPHTDCSALMDLQLAAYQVIGWDVGAQASSSQ